MHYKTIALELLQENPALHERLKASRTLLATMERRALELKGFHAARMEQLKQARPQSAPEQITSEALELAVEDLRASIADECSPNATETA